MGFVSNNYLVTSITTLAYEYHLTTGISTIIIALIISE